MNGRATIAAAVSALGVAAAAGGYWAVTDKTPVPAPVLNLFGAAACGCTTPSFPGGTGVANIWVDTTAGGSPTRCSSPCAYVAGNAYGSFNAAYQAASPGDTIKVKTGSGSYPTQTIATNTSLRNLSPACDPYAQWGAASTVNCVKIQPAPGETVTINGSLEVHGSDLWVAGTATGAVTSGASRTFNIVVNGYVDTEADSPSAFPEHDTIEGIHSVNAGTFSSTNIYLHNLNVGPATLDTGCRMLESQGGSFENAVGLGGGIAVVPAGVVWDGLYIYQQNRDQNGGNSDCHGGGMFIKCTTGFTLENSVFSQNFVYDVQEQDVGCGAQASNVTMQNNWFGCPTNSIFDNGGNGINNCDGQADVQFNASGQYTNHLYRYNAMSDGFGCSGLSCTFSNARFVGNLGSISTNQVCGVTGTTWGYNAWVGTNGSAARTCGGTDVSVSSSNTLSLLFTTPSVTGATGSFDLHLPSTSATGYHLVSTGTGDYALTTDMTGLTRSFPANAGANANP